jgi:hypothetical protein
MIEIPMHEVELVPEGTLGNPTDDAPLHGRLTFGWDVLPGDHDDMPPDWLSYVKGASDRSFRQLLMVCSFRPETPQSKGEFRHASLGIALSTSSHELRPIARLIAPNERTHPISGHSSGLSFTVKAGMFEVGVQRPPASGTEREEWIVRGYGASQPNPQWEFRRIKHFSLVGDHPVAALVELVHGHANAAEVLLAAELEHRRWGIRRYHAPLALSQHAIVLAR